MAFNIHVRVRPVILFQICDAYERRNMENHRVIGTLLGKPKISLLVWFPKPSSLYLAFF